MALEGRYAALVELQSLEKGMKNEDSPLSSRLRS